MLFGLPIQLSGAYGGETVTSITTIFVESQRGSNLNYKITFLDTLNIICVNARKLKGFSGPEIGIILCVCVLKMYFPQIHPYLFSSFLLFIYPPSLLLLNVLRMKRSKRNYIDLRSA